MNLRQHLVETVDELAQFIGAPVGDADRIILVLRHGTRRPGQPQDRIGNDPLQPAGQRESHQQRRHKHQPHDPGIAPEPVGKLVQIRHQQNRAEGVVTLSDAPRQKQMASGEPVAGIPVGS